LLNKITGLDHQKKTSYRIIMPPKKAEPKKTGLTAAEKKKQKQENKAKANPGKAAAKKEKADAKRERRKESGSVKKMG